MKIILLDKHLELTYESSRDLNFWSAWHLELKNFNYPALVTLIFEVPGI